GGAQRAARRLGQRQQVRDEGRVVAVGLEVGQVDVPRPLPRRGSGPGQEAIDDVVVVEDPRRQRQAEAEACGGGQDQRAARGAGGLSVIWITQNFHCIIRCLGLLYSSHF